MAYTEVMALLAENEKGMVHMLGKLEGNLDKKSLEINVKRKTRVMWFRKGGGECWM